MLNSWKERDIDFELTTTWPDDDPFGFTVEKATPLPLSSPVADYSKECKCEHSIGQTWCCNQCGLPYDTRKTVPVEKQDEKLYRWVDAESKHPDPLLITPCRFKGINIVFNAYYDESKKSYHNRKNKQKYPTEELEWLEEYTPPSNVK